MANHAEVRCKVQPTKEKVKEILDELNRTKFKDIFTIEELEEDDTEFTFLLQVKKEFIDHNMKNDRFRFVCADLIDEEILLESVKGHDVVFHIAANPDVRMGVKKPDIARKDIIATYNLLDSMRVNNIKKIVFSSSSTIYGETPSFPLKEDYGPLLPISVYGAAKLASEGLISSFWRK